MSRFLIYSRGPFQLAIAIIRQIIANVKHITNFEGSITIVKTRIKHIKRKNVENASAIAAIVNDFSLGRKLNIDSQPWGSVSLAGLPSTKLLARSSALVSPKTRVEGCFSRS